MLSAGCQLSSSSRPDHEAKTLSNMIVSLNREDPSLDLKIPHSSLWLQMGTPKFEKSPNFIQSLSASKVLGKGALLVDAWGILASRNSADAESHVYDEVPGSIGPSEKEEKGSTEEKAGP